MRWIEIITLRSLAKTHRQFVEKLLAQIVTERGRGCPASIKVYRRFIVETDLSIHFYWETGALPPCASPLGQRLTSALKGLGLINHSIWVEAETLERPAALVSG